MSSTGPSQCRIKGGKRLIRNRAIYLKVKIERDGLHRLLLYQKTPSVPFNAWFSPHRAHTTHTTCSIMGQIIFWVLFLYIGIRFVCLFVLRQSGKGFYIKRPCPNVSTTQLRQWGFRQCLPFSWTTLRGKHCRHSIAAMGVVNMFGPNLYCLTPVFHHTVIAQHTWPVAMGQIIF